MNDSIRMYVEIRGGTELLSEEEKIALMEVAMNAGAKKAISKFGKAKSGGEIANIMHEYINGPFKKNSDGFDEVQSAFLKANSKFYKQNSVWG